MEGRRDEGDMVSTGDTISGLCRLVLEVARASRDVDGLVWIRNVGSAAVVGDAGPVNDPVRVVGGRIE